MKKLFTTLFSVLTLAVGSVSGQQAGTLDLTFNGTGKVIYNRDNMDLYQDVKVQTDGKIVTVGTSYNPSWSSVIEVTRYLADGSFDPDFGIGGHFNYSTGIETGANKCIIKNDGKILVCGYTTDYATYSFVLLQLNADGTLDPSFGTNGVVLAQTSWAEKNAFAMALQSDGKILLAGFAANNDYRNAPVVLRFSETGILDTSFGTNGIATIPVTEIDNDFSAIEVQSNGKIVAAGHISNGMSWFSLLIARFDENGNLDPGYATNGIVNLNLGNVDDEFYDIHITADNKAILTGFTVSQGDFKYHLLLMKFNSDGSPSTSFGLGGHTIWGEVPYSFGDAMTVQPDGKILIAGSTGELAPGNNDWALWRFNPDGNIDMDFGTNGVATTDFFGNAEEALGVALSGNKILLAGKTRNAENKLDFALARYLNDVSVSVPDVELPGNFSISPNPVKRDGTVNIEYELTQSGTINIELLNPSGKSFLMHSLGIQQSGIHTCPLSLPAGISAGVYFVRIYGSQLKPVTMKVVVM